MFGGFGLIRTLNDDSGQVLGISFAPNGKILASVSLDRFTRLWDVHTGNVIRRIPNGKYPSRSVSFFPGGRKLVVGGGELAFSVVDAANGERIYNVPILLDDRSFELSQTAPLAGNSCGVDFVTISRDGKLIASSDICGVVALRRADDGTVLRLIQRHYSYPGFVPAPRAGPTTLSFFPDDTKLAGGSGNLIVIWQVATGREIVRLEGHQGHASAVAFAPTEQAVLVSGSWDMTVILWSFADRKPLWTYTVPGKIDLINDVAFSPNRKLIAVAHWRFARLIDASTGQPFSFRGTRQ